MVPSRKMRILAIFINPKQLQCVTLGPYVTQIFIIFSAVLSGKKILITQIFSLFARNNNQVLLNIKLPVALELKVKVIFLGPRCSIFKVRNPSKSLKLQSTIICHQMTLYKISFNMKFSLCLEENFWRQNDAAA